MNDPSEELEKALKFYAGKLLEDLVLPPPLPEGALLLPSVGSEKKSPVIATTMSESGSKKENKGGKSPDLRKVKTRSDLEQTVRTKSKPEEKAVKPAQTDSGKKKKGSRVQKSLSEQEKKPEGDTKPEQVEKPEELSGKVSAVPDEKTLEEAPEENVESEELKEQEGESEAAGGTKDPIILPIPPFVNDQIGPIQGDMIAELVEFEKKQFMRESVKKALEIEKLSGLGQDGFYTVHPELEGILVRGEEHPDVNLPLIVRMWAVDEFAYLRNPPEWLQPHYLIPFFPPETSNAEIGFAMARAEANLIVARARVPPHTERWTPGMSDRFSHLSPVVDVGLPALRQLNELVKQNVATITAVAQMADSSAAALVRESRNCTRHLESTTSDFGTSVSAKLDHFQRYVERITGLSDTDSGKLMAGGAGVNVRQKAAPRSETAPSDSGRRSEIGGLTDHGERDSDSEKVVVTKFKKSKATRK